MATMNGFDTYKVRIHGGNRGRTALLLCYDEGAFVGRIDFYADDVEPPDDLLWHPNPTAEYVVLSMPMSRFHPVMTTVRQEKPLHLYINVDRGGGVLTEGEGHLATTDEEPVGEQEGIPTA
jgi:hypothetical protein